MQDSGMIIGGGLLLFGVVLLLLMLVLSVPSRRQERVRSLASGFKVKHRRTSAGMQAVEHTSELVNSMRRSLGLQISPRSQERLISAGYRHRNAPKIYLSILVLSPLVAGLLASFIQTNTLFCVLVLGALGYVLPDFILSTLITRRRRRIRRGLPDAIDLLVICVGAGLGLDHALLRVGEDLAISYPDLHDEFARVQLEQRAGLPRTEAWQNLSNRLGLEEITAFTSMLNQTERFGTPITRALTRFAEDLRLKRRQQAEEAAAKTKIQIVFPLVFFIFPNIFLVLLAPALIAISGGLSGSFSFT